MVENEHCDLRMLSLLHALCDKEEVIREALRLLTIPDMDDASWTHVRDIGRDIAPEHPLFDPDQSLAQVHNRFNVALPDLVGIHPDDPRQEDKRVIGLRLVSDRQSEDRRANSLPGQGEERRRDIRRYSRKMYLVN